ncbi:MAG: hypothetical protein MJZ64_06795 [Paludibacteraceae bacterium]|nr:hypothetical protein [Paludibacteraceae bacterium]
MKHIFLLAFTITTALLTGCKTTETAVEAKGVPSGNQVQTMPVANTEQTFCSELLKQSIAEKENVFLSPASAAMALSMLTPGAAGQTQQELKNIVPAISLDTTQQLKVASAIWINEGFKVKPAFLQANSNAEVYAGKITANKVNKWADQHTNGKIAKIMSEPMPRYEMILTNALYFKAQWRNTFYEFNTEKEPFFGTLGEKKIDMMHQTTHFQYSQNDLYQAIRMFYTSPYCMDIILPREGQKMEDIVDSIQQIDMSLAPKKKVELSMPKFKMEYEKQLNDYLKTMGLRTCFSREADFSPLSNTPVYVDLVKQNTFLSIDEEGTEAAAVTTIAMKAMAFRPEPEQIYEMKINRPFILFIRETESNRVLFFGVIKNL